MHHRHSVAHLNQMLVPFLPHRVYASFNSHSNHICFAFYDPTTWIHFKFQCKICAPLPNFTHLKDWHTMRVCVCHTYTNVNRFRFAWELFSSTTVSREFISDQSDYIPLNELRTHTWNILVPIQLLIIQNYSHSLLGKRIDCGVHICVCVLAGIHGHSNTNGNRALRKKWYTDSEYIWRAAVLFLPPFLLCT